MNRATVGMSDPSMVDLKRKLDPVLAANSASSDLARQCFQDFHTLVHLFRLELLSRDDSQVLCEAVRDGKENPALWVKFLACSSWLSVKKVLLEANLSASSSKTKTFAPWPCPHCTFSNENDPVNCEMCGLPKNWVRKDNNKVDFIEDGPWSQLQEHLHQARQVFERPLQSHGKRDSDPRHMQQQSDKSLDHHREPCQWEASWWMELMMTWMTWMMMIWVLINCNLNILFTPNLLPYEASDVPCQTLVCSDIMGGVVSARTMERLMKTWMKRKKSIALGERERKERKHLWQCVQFDVTKMWQLSNPRSNSPSNYTSIIKSVGRYSRRL